MTNTIHQEKMSLLFTVHEVADILRVDDTTVRRWIKNGVLEAVRLPHLHKRESYRIRQETVETLLSGTSRHR
jgi:excisionase family DNA binding protein